MLGLLVIMIKGDICDFVCVCSKGCLLVWPRLGTVPHVKLDVMFGGQRLSGTKTSLVLVKDIFHQGEWSSHTDTIIRAVCVKPNMLCIKVTPVSLLLYQNSHSLEHHLIFTTADTYVTWGITFGDDGALTDERTRAIFPLNTHTFS